MKKILLKMILAVLFLLSLFFWCGHSLLKIMQSDINLKRNLQEMQVVQDEPISQNIDAIGAEIKSCERVQPEKMADVKVPFTSQAPLGDWNDQRLQNGCEEASMTMAMRWIQNRNFASPADARQEIIDISKFEEKIFGNYADTSVSDVGKILSQYYHFENFSISDNVTLESLKAELAKGNIILAPVFGRALNNPNYTRPGPITHMLVLTGFDAKTKEFVTNDSGTKKGSGYRYDENVLFAAIWAYPSSKIHPPPPKETARKAMLVVEHD